MSEQTSEMEQAEEAPQPRIPGPAVGEVIDVTDRTDSTGWHLTTTAYLIIKIVGAVLFLGTIAAPPVLSWLIFGEWDLRMLAIPAVALIVTGIAAAFARAT